MKTLKSLLMLCAGLSFCACGSDNEPQVLEGTGKVVVKIVAPKTTTRGTADANTTGNDGKINVDGTYTVILSAAKGGGKQTFDADENQTKTITFTGVSSPTRVKVILNDGVADYKSSTIDTLNVKNETSITALNVPAYGETTNFTQETKTEGGTEVTIYEAAVNMAIPVARLEVGPISFNKTNTVFDELTIGGVYLDKLRDQGGKYNQTTGVFECQASETPTNYQYGETENECGVGIEAVLKDVASGSFLGEQSTVLPTTGVYAYNFFGATPGATFSADLAVLNPQFKIYFSSTSLSNTAETTKRYAMIKKYKNKSGDEILLENGKIYQVTDVELLDRNIIEDEEGNVAEYNLEVTVTEAVWEIVETTGEWAE